MTLFRVIWATAITLTVPAIAFSQPPTRVPQPEPSLRTVFSDLARDVRHLPSSNGGTLSIAIGGILSSSLHPLDDEVAGWDPSAAYKPGRLMGNPVVLSTGTLLIYGVGAWADSHRTTHVAADALRAQLLSLGLAYSLKYTVRRERPDETTRDSFPSGHAAQSFATATVVARHFGAKWGVPAFGAAGFISASRLNQQRHFLSDVVFGAGLGIGVGWNGMRPESRWSVTPAVSRSSVAVRIERR
jgi:membrane-associated phospholipid phosphatase